MAKFVEMDENNSLKDQMESQVKGPVILINKFNVKSDEVEQFLKAWERMLLSSKTKQGLFLHNYIKALVRALYLSTMRFGNP
jgi:hypothetical protein